MSETSIKFINEGSYQFIDISSEEWREYHYYNQEKNNWHSIRINGAVKLSVGGSGHRLFDEAGVSYFIKSEWLYITWKAKDGQPNFVK